MVKIMHTTSLSIISWILSFSILCQISLSKEVELPKEVVDFYTITPLPADDLDHNLYIWGISFNYPEDNYYEIGKEMAQYNYQLGEKIASEELELWEAQKKIRSLEDYLQGEKALRFINDLDDSQIINHCSIYGDADCIKKTVADQKRFEHLSNSNHSLQKHYEEIADITNDSVGYFHPFSYAVVTFPDVKSILKLIDLDLAQAIVDFSHGQTHQGIERLERVSYFANLTHEGTMILPIMQLATQQMLNQTIDALLDAQLITPNAEFLRSLYDLPVDRFQQKIKHSLKWQARVLMLNNYYLFQEYKEQLLLDGAEAEIRRLADEQSIAMLLYDYYMNYVAILNHPENDMQSLEQFNSKLSGLPFHVYLVSPYEYLMQAKYQAAYEDLLKTKINLLNGGELNDQSDIQLSDDQQLFIELNDHLEKGSPLLPQPMRWFNGSDEYLDRLEVNLQGK